jgi:hypothetical protein
MISIIVVCIILIVYISIYNIFQSYLLKINETEKEIDESLRKKYDILFKIKQKEDLEIEMQEIKDKNLSSFEFYREIIEIETNIINLTNNRKIEKEDLDEINIKIESQIKYYNENISNYNNATTKFPSNIISKISRKKIKNYFDDKNLYDKNKKDFKI